MKTKKNEQNHYIGIDYDISVTKVTYVRDFSHQKKNELNRHL